MILHLLLVTCIYASTSALNSYIILAPKVIRPGLTENITVALLKGNGSEIVIQAAVEDSSGKILSESHDKFLNSDPKALQLKIPDDIQESGQYQIRVSGTKGLIFINRTEVFVKSKNISIFIQTDKGKYKAGQTIRIRSFGLYPNGSIYLGNLTLEITDPKANIIKKWQDLQEPSFGVVSKTLAMDDKPVLGEWKVKATLQGVSQTNSFEVAEYVLPKFKLEVSLPQYALTTDNEISGRAKATYTYGRPVSGEFNFTVTMPGLSQSLTTWKGAFYKHSTHITKDTKFTIPLKHLHDHLSHNGIVADHVGGTQLKIDVTFKDDLTDKTLSQTSFVKLKSHSVTFAIINSGSTRYIPGLEYPIKIQFTDVDGRPPAKNLLPCHLIMTSYHKDSRNINTELSTQEFDKKLLIPVNGNVELNIDMPTSDSNTTKTEIKVTHDGVSKTLTLMPYDNSQTHVRLRVLSSNHKVGNKVQLQLQSNNPITSIYYQIVSRGIQVSSGKKGLPGGHNNSFEFELTKEMTPEIAILVYDIDNATENIYADQTTVEVQGILTNAVSLQFGQSQAEPGTNVSLKVQTDPHSMLHLLAIDTSSLLLGNGNDITENKVLEDAKSFKPDVTDKLYFYKRRCDTTTMVKVEHNELYSAHRFEEAGITVLTDVIAYDVPSYKFHPYYDLTNQWYKWQKSCNKCCPDHNTTTTTTSTTRTYPTGAFPTIPGLYPGQTPAPNLAFAISMGCFRNGAFYHKGEKWTEGCLYNCICDSDQGHYTCIERCRSFTNVPVPYCGLVTDPNDHCCKIPTCQFIGSVSSGKGTGIGAGGTINAGSGGFGSLTTPAATGVAHSHQAQPGSFTQAQHVRKEFPETWIWTSEYVGGSGYVNISSTVPDSITSWVASAFSINKVSGLGVTQASSKLNVFRPFFININLPFSVIHGEEVVLQVNVFNYLTENLTVLVTLDRNEDFKNIIVDDLGYTSYKSMTRTESVRVPSGDSVSSYFPIIPSIIGKIDISVKAQSTVAADAVKRQLRVEPEGIPKEYNVPLVIDMTNASTNHHSVPIEFPPSLVKGSERVQILAIGDFMGPSVSGLDRLLTLPTGCGEQTMIGFAPDVYLYNYLQYSGQLTGELQDTAITFMERGYQRELRFQHTDGSFSVWGPDDTYGSTWLTAFVLNSFTQAANYIEIDSGVLEKAHNWLINQQDRYDGSFSEQRGVQHMSLQGGSYKRATLTAFVTIALIESKDVSGSSQSDQAIRKAKEYLESEIKYLKDPYDIAIISYALLRAGSTKAPEAMKKLEKPAPSNQMTTTPKPGCDDPPADIVFVLDSSGSIGTSNYQKILKYVRDVVRGFDYSNRKTQVSVVIFSSRVYEVFPLNAYSDINSIEDAVSHAPYYAGGTDTAAALQYVNQNSFTVKKGGRSNSTKIVIVITDGQSNDPRATKSEAAMLRSAGVTTYSVGIGYGIGTTELNNIATDSHHVFRASDYESLQQIKLSLGNENCQVVDIKIPWETSGKFPNYLWNSPNTRATPVDIETSSYVMLYYTASKQYIKGQKILEWILKQRNSNGGFASTQDTVLALQALSEIVRYVHGGSSAHASSSRTPQNLNVNVKTHNESHLFNINQKNKMVLQKFEPSGTPPVVNISASGQGVALIQVAVDYHVFEQIEKPTFTLDVTIVSQSMETISTKMCTRYNGTTGTSTGMAIVEYGIPSGFDADLDSIISNTDIKKTEINDRIVVFYLNEITKSDSCISINVERSTMVANVKPSPIRVYDYYNPESQVTTFYTPNVLKNKSYCEVCATCKCGKHRK